jgi:hypothetical protein
MAMARPFSMETLMPADGNNVLLPLQLPTQKSLRSAVAHIIRDVQRDHGETDQCTADRLGVSIGTIRNARNESADLGAVTIARIGAVYGAAYVDPYHRLYGSVAAPIEASGADPLPDLARSVAMICEMRSPSGEGGAIETPKEQLDALPDLKRTRAALDAYINRIEKLRLVA